MTKEQRDTMESEMNPSEFKELLKRLKAEELKMKSDR